MALTWQDKKPIHFLSTINPAPKPNDQVFAKCRKKDGTLEDVPCPDIVQMYNKYMGIFYSITQLWCFTLTNKDKGLETKASPFSFFAGREKEP